MSVEARPKRTKVRIGFAVYTLALLTATHWPGLAIRGPVDRTDLIIHCGSFCTWTCLLYWTRLVGGRCRSRRLIWSCALGMCFAVFDESTQPLFRRVFDWWDLVADLVGVILAGGIVRFFQRFWVNIKDDLGE